MAWRDDCTKHKPKTGGMSTKFGEAKKSSLSPTKRLRITQRITQRIPAEDYHRREDYPEDCPEDSSDIRRFGGGDQYLHEEDAKPQRNFRSKPFDVNRSRFNFVKQIDEISFSPISSTPVIIQPQGSTAFHSVPQGSTAFHSVPQRSTRFHKVRDDDRYGDGDPVPPLEEKRGEM